jgi:thiol-disulfide isomerase/thioredoxin
MWQRRLARVATASMAGGVAAYHMRPTVQLQAAPDRAQLVTGEQQMRLQLLGQAVQQAQGLLTDPPVALQRFGKAWMQYVQPDEVQSCNLARDTLRAALTDISKLPVSSIDDEVVTRVHMAVRAAGAAVERLRAAAALRAARRPWHGLMGGRTLEPAQGGGVRVPTEAALHGKTVLLYFTASWCPPCRRFSPALVALYEAAKAEGSAFEVVMVPWDHDEQALRQYARTHDMRWLAVSWEDRELADELSLRFDVRHVPTVVVLDVDAAGAARVLSTEGRTEVLEHAAGRGAPAWLRGREGKGGEGGATGGGRAVAESTPPPASLWRRVFG